MSALEQELAFWRERSRLLRQRQEALKAHTSQAASLTRGSGRSPEALGREQASVCSAAAESRVHSLLPATPQPEAIHASSPDQAVDHHGEPRGGDERVLEVLHGLSTDHVQQCSPYRTVGP